MADSMEDSLSGTDDGLDNSSESVVSDYQLEGPNRERLTLSPSIDIKALESIVLPEIRPNGRPINGITVGLGWEAPIEIDLDAYCIVLDQEANLLETVYFENLEGMDGAILHLGDNRTGDGLGDDERISVTRADLPSEAFCLMFVVNSFSGETFAEVSEASMRIVSTAHAVEEAEEGEGESESDAEEQSGGDQAEETNGKKEEGGSSSYYSEEGDDGEAKSPRDEEEKDAPEEPVPVEEAPVDPLDDETKECEICTFQIACEGDNNTLVLGNMYRTKDRNALKFQASGLPTVGDSIEDMMPQMLQSLRNGIIDGIAELTEEQFELPPTRTMTEDEASETLSMLGATPDGLSHAFLKAHMENTLITDISVLSTFCHLQFVDMPDNKITDLAPLAALDSLLSINFSANSLTSWSTLTSRSFLEEVDLANNWLTEVTTVNHPALRSLRLAGNRIKVVSGLQDASTLTHLDLRDNRVQSIRKVRAPGLKELYLAGNEIRVVGKASMPKLQTLHLRDNKIVLLKGLEVYKSLTYLNLRDNKISDLNELKNLSTLVNLKSLNLIGNLVYEDASDTYRYEIILIWPRLEILDKEPITKEERLDAEEMSKAPDATDAGHTENDSDTNSMYLSDMSAMVVSEMSTISSQLMS